MFKKINRVEIITDDLERSVDFYTNVLSFTPKPKQRIERSILGVPLDVVLLDLGGTAVELLSYRGATVARSPTGEQLSYRMMALEAEIRDPHGHRIELGQWF
jgi:catechol-2,3-dioxygenase